MTDKTIDNIVVGAIVYGYAGGMFGRDSYEDRTVIHKGFYNGEHYVVLSSMGYGSTPLFYVVHGDEVEELVEYLEPEIPDWDS